MDSFADEPGGDRVRAQHELATKILRDNQWRVIEVTRGMSCRRSLDGAGSVGGGGLMRASDRLIVASVVAVFLATFTLTPLTSDGGFLGIELVADRAAGGAWLSGCAGSASARARCYWSSW